LVNKIKSETNAERKSLCLLAWKITFPSWLIRTLFSIIDSILLSNKDSVQLIVEG